ncbi:MAG: DMT family transporter [Anaerolineae bacterium]|nr:DMT family transporter [Anaerolineae bacterium]
MQSVFIAAIIGLAAGAAVGFQAPLANLVSRHLGPIESVFIIHLGGALVAAVPLIFMGGGKLSAWQGVPWYALAAGAFGFLVISAISYTMPRIGVASTVTLMVVAQLAVSAVLDKYGMLGLTERPFDASRLTGFAVLLLGTWLVVR